MELILKLTDKTKKRLPFYLFLLVLALYFSFLSKFYYFDGILYAIWTELGIKYTMFHPHHILYCPLGFVILKLFRLFGYFKEGGYGVHLIFQSINALFGALGVVLFFVLMKRIIKDIGLTVLVSLLFAFSYGYWNFSIHIHGIMPSCFFLIATLFLLQKSKSPYSKRNYLLIGLAHGMAILFHVSAILFLPAALISMILRIKERSVRLKAILLYSLSLFLIVGVAYSAVVLFVWHFSSWGEIYQWFFRKFTASYAPFGYKIDYWSFNWSNIPLSFSILRNTILGNYFVANKDRMLPFTYYSLLSLTWMARTVYLFILFYFILSFKKLWRRHANTIAFSLIWIFAYAVFFTRFFPGVIKSWTSTLIPISILTGIIFLDLSKRGFKKVSVRGNTIALATVTLLFVTNFFGTILPQSDERNNIDLQKAVFLRENTNLGDLIILAGGGKGYNIGRVYIPYFSARSKLPLNQAIDGRLNDPFFNVAYRIYMERERGHKVFALSEVLENSEAIKTIAKNHRLRPSDIITFFSNYKIEYVTSYDEEFKLYEIVQ